MKKFTLLIFAALFLLQSSFAATIGFVLCIEEGGSAKIELAESKCCSDLGIEPCKDHRNNIKIAVETCEKCTDIPLFSEQSTISLLQKLKYKIQPAAPPIYTFLKISKKHERHEVFMPPPEAGKISNSINLLKTIIFII